MAHRLPCLPAERPGPASPSRLDGHRKPLPTAAQAPARSSNGDAALGAIREIVLATKDASEIERFKRFWVQGVDGSGIQQSEYEETGEGDFFAADGDGDGTPRMEYGDGKYGIAPVFASRVEIRTPTAAVARK